MRELVIINESDKTEGMLSRTASHPRPPRHISSNGQTRMVAVVSGGWQSHWCCVPGFCFVLSRLSKLPGLGGIDSDEITFLMLPQS